MTLKPNKLTKPAGERYIEWFRIAQNRSYTLLDCDRIAKAAIVWDRNGQLTGVPAADQTLFLNFLKVR